MHPVYFIGAGPGDPELLTIKGRKKIEEADVVIYAGLVNPLILKFAKNAKLYNSSKMNLEEIISVIVREIKKGKKVVRLHDGDPTIYGAIGEQISALENKGIKTEIIPGVSSFLAAAAALKKEYTLPGVSQAIIICRIGDKTEVPTKEDLAELAKHGSSMCIFLSAHLMQKAVEKLKSGYPPETPAAIVHKVSWKDEKIVLTTIDRLPQKIRESGIEKTALVLVGDFLKAKGKASKVYGN
jgi:precorrin-4/cobalt-precorrin-4 C11-methyltransferase